MWNKLGVPHIYVCLHASSTVKVLKIGTPKVIKVIMLKMKQFGFTMQ